MSASRPANRPASPSAGSLYQTNRVQTEEGRGTGQIKKEDSPISNKQIRGTKSEKSKRNEQQNTNCLAQGSEKSFLRSNQKDDMIIKNPMIKDTISEMKKDFPSTRKVLKPNIESKVSMNQKSIAVEKWVENQNKYLDKGNPSLPPHSNIIED